MHAAMVVWSACSIALLAAAVGLLVKEFYHGPRNHGRYTPALVKPLSQAPPPRSHDSSYTSSSNVEESEERRKFFTDVYRNNAWASGESRSGWGSEDAYTAPARAFLESILSAESVHKLGIRTLADAPCGDHSMASGLGGGKAWIRRVPSISNGAVQYVGFDIVQEIVNANRASSGREWRGTYQQLDIVLQQLPRAFDAVLTRDALQHMRIGDAMRAVRNIEASGARFLITNYHDHPALEQHGINPNLLGSEAWSGAQMRKHGGQKFNGFFPINVMYPPFNFPAPLVSAAEGVPGSLTHDFKRIGIWELPLKRSASADASSEGWAAAPAALLRQILDSGNVKALIEVGGAFFLYNQHPAALRFYQKANAVSPALARAHQAKELLRRGDKATAARTAKEALASVRDSGERAEVESVIAASGSFQ